MNCCGAELRYAARTRSCNPSTFNSKLMTALLPYRDRTSSITNNPGNFWAMQSASNLPSRSRSWQMSAFASEVRRASNSKPSQPCCKARSKASKVFSGAYLLAPRWPRRIGLFPEAGRSVARGIGLPEIYIANVLGIGSFFSALYRFLEFLFQQVG